MERHVFATRIAHLLPSRRDWAESFWPAIRGTCIGFFLGVLPGGGPMIASFVSYAIEKKVSKSPEKFGTGMIAGVAGPEAANNAATGGAFVPLMTLGIPGNATTALLLGALIIYGVQPGPKMVTEHADLFWGVIASMYIGNAMLLVLNLPLIGLWVKILKVPYPILFPLILLFCLIGAYSLNNSITEVGIMVLFGVLGYLFKKFEYEMAPLILGLVLGPLMEHGFRASLTMFDGRLLTFFQRPICAAIMSIAVVILILPMIPGFKKGPGFQEV
jgi:putative tricarboxylic transport membrane protein